MTERTRVEVNRPTTGPTEDLTPLRGLSEAVRGPPTGTGTTRPTGTSPTGTRRQNWSIRGRAYGAALYIV